MGKKLWASANINGYETSLWDDTGRGGHFLQLKFKRNYMDKRQNKWREMYIQILPQHVNVAEELIRQGFVEMRKRVKIIYKEKELTRK